MSVGVGVGLVFLAREGLNLTTLQSMEEREESSAEDVLEHLLDEEAEPEAPAPCEGPRRARRARLAIEPRVGSSRPEAGDLRNDRRGGKISVSYPV